jgi:hypothetical protein
MRRKTRSTMGVWRSRKIAECDRIKEEEKRERLAVVKIKKNRYRLEIARANTNFWRNHRRQREEMDEEEAMAWENIKVGIMILEEEDGEWIMEEDDIRLLDNTTTTNQVIMMRPILEVGEKAEAKRMEEGTKEVLEDRSTNHDEIENDSNTSTQEEGIVRERKRKLSGSMGEGVRNNKEEVDGVRSKIWEKKVIPHLRLGYTNDDKIHMKYGLMRVVAELIINENDEKIMETVMYYIFIYPTLL